MPPSPRWDPFWGLLDRPTTIRGYISKEIKQLPSTRGLLDTEERGIIYEVPPGEAPVHTVSPALSLRGALTRVYPAPWRAQGGSAASQEDRPYVRPLRPTLFPGPYYCFQGVANVARPLPPHLGSETFRNPLQPVRCQRRVPLWPSGRLRK